MPTTVPLRHAGPAGRKIGGFKLNTRKYQEILNADSRLPATQDSHRRGTRSGGIFAARELLIIKRPELAAGLQQIMQGAGLRDLAAFDIADAVRAHHG